MRPKVSVVVPIYCVEQYLSQCIDSLLVQTLQEIEIILVDDGSPDSCGEIADRYAQKDKRIKVIHQSNAGLGPARNSGMKIATGEYIGFVDSDDWVKPKMYERLYEAAIRSDADIVASGHCDITDGKVVKVKPHPLKGKILDTAADVSQMRKNLYGYGIYDKTVEAFPMSVWISIYKRSMIEDKSLRFQNILSEDRIFNLNAYKYAKTIACIGDTDYCYRKEGQTSITQTFSRKKQQQYKDILTVLYAMALSEEEPECVMRAKRMAIDYCRLYVGLVDNSRESFRRKKYHVREFAQTKEISQCWEGYPMGALPIQQRIFHWMIINELYGAALILNWMRRRMGKGSSRNHGIET